MRRSIQFLALLLFICTLGAAYASGEDVFDRLDQNADGQLKRSEVEERHQRLFDRLLRLGDANEDGQLSKEEFIAETTTDRAIANPAGGRPSADRPVRGQFDPQQLFARLDRDNDEKLSKDEAPERMRENFDRIDQNSDGFIDQRELGRIAAAMRDAANRNRPDQPRSTNPQMAAVAERIFKERDTNQDGKVSIDEVPQERREGFRRLLQQFDVDPEVGLTKEQFQRALSRFNRRPQ